MVFEKMRYLYQNVELINSYTFQIILIIYTSAIKNAKNIFLKKITVIFLIL